MIVPHAVLITRQAEARSRILSKKEKEAAEAEEREAALKQTIDDSNKGFKMLAKLGYTPGTGLGKAKSGVPEPISVTIKEDRGGIGKESDKKRKLQDAIESANKKVRESEGDYRERVRLEHIEKRLEGQLYAAQKLAEGFDIGADLAVAEDGKAPVIRPLKGKNSLWRGIARDRILRDRERRRKHDMLQSGPRLGTFVDPDEDADDKLALGKSGSEIPEEELEEEDSELEEFVALPVADRLDKVVTYLRDQYNYCFWCKYRYPDNAMDGCPGLTEEDHD